MSIKFLSAILGLEMAAPILGTPGKMHSFCRKSHVHKIPRFGGGGGGILGFLVGGGGVPILFLWARGIFLNINPEVRNAFAPYRGQNPQN